MGGKEGVNEFISLDMKLYSPLCGEAWWSQYPGNCAFLAWMWCSDH